jgi:hypothetical protein
MSKELHEVGKFNPNTAPAIVFVSNVTGIITSLFKTFPRYILWRFFPPACMPMAAAALAMNAAARLCISKVTCANDAHAPAITPTAPHCASFAAHAHKRHNRKPSKTLTN